MPSENLPHDPTSVPLPETLGRSSAGPRWQPPTGWPWPLAVLVAIAILAAAILAAQAAMAGLAALGVTATHWVVPAALITSQIVAIALTWRAAGRDGISPRDALALGPPAQGKRAYVSSFLILVSVVAAVSVLTWLYRRDLVLQDLQTFIDLIRSPGWWLAILAIVVGAPLMEELLFRGFLLAHLARTRIGFRGAAVVTTLAWTGLHAGYSGIGLLEVLLVGFYFCGLVWWTGSLRVPILCHALHNLTVVAILGLVDLQAMAA